MNLFKLIPQDKANHEVYGARLAAGAGIIVAVALLSFKAQLVVAIGASSAAAFVIAAAAGKVKEMMDDRANKKAVAAGEAPPHEVSRQDSVATMKGGLSVALPMAVVCLLAVVNG